jgi:hypothetical protein
MIEIDQIQKNSSKKKVYAENYTGRKIHPIFIYFLLVMATEMIILNQNYCKGIQREPFYLL